MSDVTRVLQAISDGDLQAAADLLPLVYDELRKLAAQKMAQEKPGQTLQTTALVHEAYLRLVTANQGPHWHGRGHFFAAAAEAMRRLLVEQARRKKRLRHGGGLQRVVLDTKLCVTHDADDSLLAINDALEQLAVDEPAAAQVVKLRYFAGLTIEQTAAAMNISVRTANRHWTFARTWLYQHLK